MTRRPVLGIVGGGQLARMTVQAASQLAVETRVLAADRDDPAVELASLVTIGDPSAEGVLEAFAALCDVVTFDHELVDPALIEALERAGHTVRPGASALRFSDKAHQRTTFGRLGLPVPDHAVVQEASAVAAFAELHGWPVVVKPSSGGYDGRGVYLVPDIQQTRIVLDQLGPRPNVVVEELLPLDQELSVVVARRPSGEAVAYPVVETVQRDGMCTELVAPAPVAAEMAETARTLALAVADTVGAVGIIAVELFLTGGRLLVNEIAPRPHNSAHHTIEGSTTSQFANHVRAVLDWPLGATDLRAPAVVMVNVVGPPDGSDPRTNLPAALAIPGAHIHLYAKASRPGRKLGHVTALGDDMDGALARARAAAAALGGSPVPTSQLS